MGEIVPQLFFYKDDFGMKYEGWYAVKKETYPSVMGRS